MRFSRVLTAALSFSVIFAFPHGGLEPLKGNELIARTNGQKGGNNRGDGGHKDSSSSKGKDPAILPGYDGRGSRNPKSSSTDPKKVGKMVKDGEQVMREHKTRIRMTKDRPEPGITGVHEETRPDGTKRFTAYLGDDMAEHTRGMQIREKKYPNSVEAEYRYETAEEAKVRRSKTVGDGPANPKDPATGQRIDGVNEEKPPAKSELIPVNIPYDRLPPPTVIKGSGAVSRERDSPLMKMVEKATKDAGTGATMRFRSNGSGKVKLPEPPIVKMDDKDAYRQMTTSSSKAGKPRSGSESSGHRRAKRDAVDMVAGEQNNAEGTHPVTDPAAEMRENLAEYMEFYGVVTSNATETIMPFVQEMVNGSDSELLWNAAWEIMSLADPSILVIGGPVFRGMHAFDWFEDSMAYSTDNQTMQSIYAIDTAIIDLYVTTWNKANDALSAAGLLDDIEVLSALTSNQTLDDSGTDATNQFFLDGLNRTLPSDNSMSVESLTENATTLATDNSTTLGPTDSRPTVNSTSSSWNITRLQLE
ncbi:MAG: hypothetical protein Q9166_000359 [cf. Caloplaca sp. 2 TL-2023]